ncbi:MAG TPA: dihydrolipoyl dehydrogenase, partial [Clostridiales bacterium]|nr:dihydrolipoyl dehydrogenase [Clostridiales bacterium]
MSSLIPGIDADLAAALRRSLEKKGVVIHTGVRVTEVENSESGVCCRFSAGDGPGQSAAADLVIAATGRRPNSENLGMENL